MIGCVLSHGRIIPSLIIYMGANHMYYIAMGGIDSQVEMKFLSHFDSHIYIKGWTGRILGIECLIEVFDKETKDIPNRRWRNLTSLNI